MEQNKRDFYKEIAEKNTNNIRTIKISRTRASKGRDNYRTYSENRELNRSKVFIKTLTILSVIGGIYLLTRNDSEIAKNILERSKQVLNNNNISIEVFEEKINSIKNFFNIQTTSTQSANGEVYIDEEEIEKMEEDLVTPKN